ncbi:MAG: hypothetical protein H6R18_1169 [Proteobacteria bacterium]|nr:hypothetical protein [Pseudomonadota bacterium]
MKLIYGVILFLIALSHLFIVARADRKPSSPFWASYSWASCVHTPFIMIFVALGSAQILTYFFAD